MQNKMYVYLDVLVSMYEYLFNYTEKRKVAYGKDKIPMKTIVTSSPSSSSREESSETSLASSCFLLPGNSSNSSVYQYKN